MDLSTPKVMGILNVTPDSFYAGSRKQSKEKIRERAVRIVEEGADIIDIGGCSTRPGGVTCTEEEELERVSLGCSIVRDLYPDFPVSVDTFRPSVARMSLENYNVQIINDVSGGIYPDIWEVVKKYCAVYVLTHNGEGINFATETSDSVADLITWCSKKVNELHRLGVNDVVVDPGFGFGKTLKQNFEILNELEALVMTGWPILIGLSRKSMIYKTLDTSPEEALVGTIALNAIALSKGAQILRVHDVRETVEVVKLLTKMKE